MKNSLKFRDDLFNKENIQFAKKLIANGFSYLFITFENTFIVREILFYKWINNSVIFINFPYKEFDIIPFDKDLLHYVNRLRGDKMRVEVVNPIKTRVSYEKRILNLTQHYASEEQIKDGVIEPSQQDKEIIRELLTFEHKPNVLGMKNRALQLREIAEKYDVRYAMVGGASYFIPFLERELLEHNIIPLHAFTRRVVEEKDGVKKSVFKHEGFIRGGVYFE